MTIRISDELHASLHSLAYQMHVPMQTLVIQGIERIVAEGDTETDNPDVSLIGKRVILSQGHPWGGQHGVVTDSDNPLRGMTVVLLDLGIRCYAGPAELELELERER